jgi:hypothetical protein
MNRLLTAAVTVMVLVALLYSKASAQSLDCTKHLPQPPHCSFTTSGGINFAFGKPIVLDHDMNVGSCTMAKGSSFTFNSDNTGVYVVYLKTSAGLAASDAWWVGFDWGGDYRSCTPPIPAVNSSFGVSQVGAFTWDHLMARVGNTEGGPIAAWVDFRACC